MIERPDDPSRAAAAFASLRAASERVLGLTDLNSVMEAFIAGACDHLGADGGGVAVFNPASGLLEVAYSTLGPERQRKPQEGISALAFARDQVVLVEMDRGLDPQAAAALDPSFESAVALPLRLAGKPVGGFGLAYRRRHRFTATEIGFLELLGVQISLHVHAADLSADLDATRRQITTIVQNAPIAVYTIDREGVIQLSEGAGLERLGLRSGELVGQSMFDLYAGNPEVIAALRRGLAGESGETVLETGGAFFANRYHPVWDESGQVAGVNGVAIDVTDQIRSAAENSAKSRFLAAMSHEMRTPLNAILGFAQLLEGGDFGPLNSRQRRHLHNILASGRQLLDLVNDALDLARVEAGELVFELAPVAVEEVIREVTEQLGPLASAKALSLEFSGKPELAVLADRRRYSQIVINLVANAVKFTESGGVRVEAAAEGDQVVTRVIDTGIGIQSSDLDRIFRDFVQLPGPGGPRPDGTGLGLALSRRLAAAMGGSLEVESNTGAGSSFEIRLPRAEAPAR